MDQIRIGRFLKECRKEKGLTQEMAAERLGVSGRTVSRWETGHNLPDISLLTELSDLYDVTIPEIINGKRNSENNEPGITAKAMAGYADAEKEMMIRNLRQISMFGLIAILVVSVMELSGNRSETVTLYCQSLISVTVIMLFLHTTGLLQKVRHSENHLPTVLKYGIGMMMAFVIACVLGYGIRFFF